MKEKINLKKAIKFIDLLQKFQKIERAIYVKGDSRKENDSEHSYQLVMFAWYLISSYKLDFDLDLIIKYALVHDLVEVYAGDTFAFDDHGKKGKQEREAKSLKRLRLELLEFEEIFPLIEGYEHREDKEAKFVYALDKILPIFNIYLDGGRSWQEKGVSLEMIIDYKKEKVAQVPELVEFFDDVLSLLKDEQKNLW